MSVPTIDIKLKSHPEIVLHMRREDLIHPQISGNKFRKLKYNIQQALKEGHKSLLTFGGAYSNHIAATAYAGRIYNFQTIGVIRGEELASEVPRNPTLRLAEQLGMQLVFVSRADYRLKETTAFLDALKARFKNPYLLPEGGTNDLAVKGCEEILQQGDDAYDFLCCSVGTGGTLAGLIRASTSAQTVVGFSSLKGQGLREDISKFVTSKNWEINSEYHFGGYAKINDALVAFINEFYSQYAVPLDPVYTGKMMFGIMDLIKKDCFSNGTRILAIHTGGLQGIHGMNERLKRQNKPQINV
jgi:1-aminocyclopropane-1-carboxylate deaminase